MKTNEAITYGSVCSGIEAASVAWEPLGLKPAWFSQFDPEHNYKSGPDFPSAVLAHHWPDVPNLGDMTKLAERVRSGEVTAPDLLVGGTPCQAFSVAGARKGMADERGQLTISYGELADAIDEQRAAAGKQPAIIVWENVPGVLSSKDNAFGAFLGLLSGEECELEPPGKKWTNVGYVSGPKRAIAWRVLDAQYFGVAQRRRRVFLIASARTDFNPARVFLESEGVRRDFAPSREARKDTTGSTGNGLARCLTAGEMKRQDWETCTLVAQKIGSHWDNPANAHPTLNQSNNIGGIGQSNQELFSQRGSGLVAYGIPGNWIGRAPENGGNAVEPMYDIAPCQTRTDIHGVAYGLAVRRLTPVECERLQGFPDNHTLVEFRGKAAPNGHRYKALGNSMAVPVMRWIGRRVLSHIQSVAI